MMQSSKIQSFDTAVGEGKRDWMHEGEQILHTSLSLDSIPAREGKKEQKKKKKKKKGSRSKGKGPKAAEEDSPSLATNHRRDGSPLSRSSPLLSQGQGKVTPPVVHGGACSDADDEILELVREETPSDRNVGTTTILSTISTPTKKRNKEKKKKNNDKKNRKGPSSGAKKEEAEDDNPSARGRERDDQEVVRYDDDGEEEEIVVAYDYEDTDDESGSCSSRFGWLFKNDKHIAGRDWSEFYDNLGKHISAGLPRREFALLDEDAVRVYSKRTDDFSCAVAPLNFQKNRYGNILPYNQNRVKLAVVDDQSDYVNASYVKLDDVLPGFRDKMTYIAASAPIPSTVEDFYRMLWETETFGIVMLTRNEEGGRPKCHQYWPEEKQTQTYGPFAVTNAEEVEYEKLSFLVRRFVLEKGGESREITQYHYLAWPDHGVPDSSEPLEEIIRLINTQMRARASLAKSDAGLKEPTLVAHCSAGIGRTGAFILVHSLLNLLFQDMKEDDEESIERWATRAPPTLDFVHLVQHMRNQRTCMISQPEQYEFCYQTVLSNLGRALRLPSPQRKGEPGSPTSASKSGKKSPALGVQRQKSCILF